MIFFECGTFVSFFVSVCLYRDNLSGSSWLSPSSRRGTLSRHRMARCIPGSSAWCRWSRRQSTRSRQTTHSRIRPLEGDRGMHMRDSFSGVQGQDRPSGGRHDGTLTDAVNISRDLLRMSSSETNLSFRQDCTC